MLRALLPAFPRRLALALNALALAIFLDVATTYVAFTRGATEGNPLAAHVLMAGFAGLVLVKLLTLAVAYGLALFVLRSRDRSMIRFYTVGLVLVAAFFFIVSLSNLSAGLLGADLYHLLTRI